MKKLEAIIRKDSVNSAVEALKAAGVGGFTITDGKGRGSGERPTVRGGRGTTSYVAEFNATTSITTLVDDGQADSVMNALADAVSTGQAGDGIIYITPVEDVLNISSKKRGSEAL